MKFQASSCQNQMKLSERSYKHVHAFADAFSTVTNAIYGHEHPRNDFHNQSSQIVVNYYPLFGWLVV